MKLIPPLLFGPVSGCSRHVPFENAVPGATVILLRSRHQQVDPIGKALATISIGQVPVDPGESLAGGDLLSAYQFTGSDASEWQSQWIEVQQGDDKFNPPLVLSHLYICSRGFSVGALRPGTIVEILQGGSLIAQGIAPDGVAHVRTLNASGLPNVGTVLRLRQRRCPIPPPPGGAPEWVFESDLPPIEPLVLPIPIGGEVPAPIITEGHSACSRSLTIEKVIPGAEVVVEDPSRGWWASSGPSDAITRTLTLPVKLKEGDRIEARQEFGCRTTSQRSVVEVGPAQQLGKLTLTHIRCATSPTLYVGVPKPEADIEFEVTHAGSTQTYRTIASKNSAPVPAPPMTQGAVVRVRQGECENWSEWSDPQVVTYLANELTEPRIVGELFQCQNTIAVENLFLPDGVLIARSNLLGEIGRSHTFGDRAAISVAPSLHENHEITVEHHFCGKVKISPMKRVQALERPRIGDFDPLYDGDSVVTLRDCTAGAYIEIWNQNRRLADGYAGFSATGRVDVAFTLASPLSAGEHIHAKFWHCAHHGRNEGRVVGIRAPILDTVSPASVAVPSSDPTAFGVYGHHFRAGSLASFGGTFVSTTFISSAELSIHVPGHLVDVPMLAKVFVRNPDGQVSGTRDVDLVARPQEPPPPPPPPAVGYDKLLLFNCHTERRKLHVWKRDVTLGTAWEFVTTLEDHYDGDWGTCPSQEAEPLEIELPDAHVIEVVAIDPQSIGCIAPGGDPSSADPPMTPSEVNAACWRGHFLEPGKVGGGEISRAFS